MRDIDKRAIKYQMYMILDRILEEGCKEKHHIFGRFTFVYEHTMVEQRRMSQARRILYK
jgi:hypothetical protein